MNNDVQNAIPAIFSTQWQARQLRSKYFKSPHVLRHEHVLLLTLQIYCLWDTLAVLYILYKYILMKIYFIKNVHLEVRSWPPFIQLMCRNLTFSFFFQVLGSQEHSLSVLEVVKLHLLSSLFLYSLHFISFPSGLCFARLVRVYSYIKGIRSKVSM